MGHLDGHTEVHLVVNGFGDEVQQGLLQPRQVRDVGLRAPWLMRVLNGVIDEFKEWGYPRRRGR
jgi:hypothetical protein